MSKVIAAAVEALEKRLPEGFPQVAKFVIHDEGAIIADPQGVRAGDAETPADVTLSASRETFEGMLGGTVNPMSAYMTGKLKLDGPMGLAMQLGQALAK
ncbi:SCP2 sterol-binding domain-containing protein [Thioclava sp. GXIMD4216]|uniref:SCP2 sterol-binding domain-containing protein n=1 Tax=unclassified Thioclava TaxID=2621713 RepID=UPI0030CC5894